MDKKYDVILVGAGPTGIFAAYELMLKAPHLKVVLIDKGHDIYHRNCPILEKKVKQCPKDIYGKTGCKPACSMTSGFGGCGAFSDGKLSLSYEVGGDLPTLIGEDFAQELIDYTDKIYLEFGADEQADKHRKHDPKIDSAHEPQSVCRFQYIFQCRYMDYLEFEMLLHIFLYYQMYSY